MKKFVACLVLAVFLLSGVALAADAGYTYRNNERFADRMDLFFAKFSLNKEKKEAKTQAVLENILAKRERHIEAHPDDLGEVEKLKADTAKLGEAGASVEAVQKHLGVLEQVRTRLEAKNVSASGVQVAIENAEHLIEQVRIRNQGLNSTIQTQNQAGNGKGAGD